MCFRKFQVSKEGGQIHLPTTRSNHLNYCADYREKRNDGQKVMVDQLIFLSGLPRFRASLREL